MLAQILLFSQVWWGRAWRGPIPKTLTTHCTGSHHSTTKTTPGEALPEASTYSKYNRQCHLHYLERNHLSFSYQLHLRLQQGSRRPVHHDCSDISDSPSLRYSLPAPKAEQYRPQPPKHQKYSEEVEDEEYEHGNTIPGEVWWLQGLSCFVWSA